MAKLRFLLFGFAIVVALYTPGYSIDRVKDTLGDNNVGYALVSHEVTNQFVRFELVYGNHKIDKKEVPYLIRSVLQTQRQNSNANIDNAVQAFGFLMTLFPTEPNVVGNFVSEIEDINIMGVSGKQTRALLQTEIENNQEQIASRTKVCEEIVSKDGQISLKAEGEELESILRQLLKTRGITPSIYKKLVLNTTAQEGLKNLGCLCR